MTVASCALDTSLMPISVGPESGNSFSKKFREQKTTFASNSSIPVL